MNKPQVVAIVKEQLKASDERYSISLYSNSGAGLIRGVANSIAEFGLVEGGYQFQFHGGVVGYGYFEVWFKFETEVGNERMA